MVDLRSYPLTGSVTAWLEIGHLLIPIARELTRRRPTSVCRSWTEPSRLDVRRPETHFARLT
jgi:hypothetical protein